MPSYSVDLTQNAASDIREIYAYIRFQLLEPETAAQQRDRIKKAVLGLSSLPKRYALISDGQLREAGVRFCPVDNYLVFYVINEQEHNVTVIRVLYSRRDWHVILSEDCSET